ncbi:MAG: hypothetical protein GY725_05220 [bacterium]|nr:hypothetical protein [bacterium]
MIVRVSQGVLAGVMFAMFLVLPAAPVATAQEVEASAPRRGAPPISFRVTVVYATQKPGEVDARALPLSNRLPMKFGSVQMLEQKALSVTFGEQVKLGLSTGGEVRLLPVAVHQNQLHMQFQMPDVVNTRLKMTNGRPMILGGVPHKDGYLIIEVLPDFTKYLVDRKPNQQTGPQTISIGAKKRAAPIRSEKR